MARTPSNTDLVLGTVCPAFELPDVLTGKAIGRDDVFGGPDDVRKGFLVAFLCVHCPFVQHMELALTDVLARYAKDIAAVAIMSNDLATNPDDSPEYMRAQATRLGWPALGIPYLLDESQETAREFHAACTPDLYLFNAQHELVYHAQFDRTRPYRQSDANAGVERHPEIHAEPHGADLEAAIQALLAGELPISLQIPSLGCNIKWHDS
jgi:AhpC/TSA family